MRVRAAALASCTLVALGGAPLSGSPLHAQTRAPADSVRVVVRDAGPGIAGRLLREALAAPHVTVTAPDTGIVLGRGTNVSTTVIVLHGPARLEGRVRGDFIVLGDLVLRPGAVIEGRAIAIGGEILNSTLAVVRGDRLVYRDVGFAVSSIAPNEYALDYRALEQHPAPLLTLPGLFGVRIPQYDRIDGLTVRAGPEFALDTGRIRVDPTIAYRSHLGVVDPSLGVTWQPGRRTIIEARAERGTFTNDAWTRGDLSNSAAAFFVGSDARNYYRADRADLTVTRDWEGTHTVLTPLVGALYERAWSVGRDSTARSAPYSVRGRHDRVEGMLRPNPRVSGGTIASALLGATLRAPVGSIATTSSLRVELPVSVPGDARFVQLTADGRVAFATFRDQSFEALAHWVGTTGTHVPSQRYAYVGGGSTIPTLHLLSEGGDQLVWLESRYAVPISAVHLPLVGSPTVTLRHIVGGAGVGSLPALTQNVGVRVSVAVIRLDIVVDPADPKRRDIGLSIGVP